MPWFFLSESLERFKDGYRNICGHVDVYAIHNLDSTPSWAKQTFNTHILYASTGPNRSRSALVCTSISRSQAALVGLRFLKFSTGISKSSWDF